MGRTAEETLRLQMQARLFDPSTRRLFEDAGIAPGMKVLELGSGAGDVALLAGDLVGRAGRVIGVDNNPEILNTARRRVQAAGATHVTFINGAIDELELADDFDAIVGRLVLIYLADPASALRKLMPRLQSGGIVAFQEIDWSSGPVAWPPSPLLEQVWQWIPEMFRRAGLNPHVGLSLHNTLVDAGLPIPSMRLEAPVGGGPDFAGYDYFAAGLRSNLPQIVRFGVATDDEVDVETFAERLRTEVVERNGTIALPVFVGAWARKG